MWGGKRASCTLSLPMRGSPLSTVRSAAHINDAECNHHGMGHPKGTGRFSQQRSAPPIGLQVGGKLQRQQHEEARRGRSVPSPAASISLFPQHTCCLVSSSDVQDAQRSRWSGGLP
mmetsp:Transcript_70512/g.146829  ORF Transcript_70512/g.146829 Transcript_70512/m.146829 type:complete len:116 (-) Transcript_70512:868-1215(-)